MHWKLTSRSPRMFLALGWNGRRYSVARHPDTGCWHLGTFKLDRNVAEVFKLKRNAQEYAESLELSQRRLDHAEAVLKETA